jgi:hypothetical protein
MIDARFNVLRGDKRRTRLADDLDAAIQKRSCNPLADMEGEIVCTNINQNAIIGKR